MKALLLATITLISFFSYNATGQTGTPLLTRSLENFKGISVSGNYKVIITEGDSFMVKIDAPSEIMDRIVTNVHNGVLKIHNKHDNWSNGEKSWYSGKSWWHNHPQVVIYVTTKKLKKLRSAGSTNIFFTDGLHTEDLTIRMLGSGVMEGSITATGSLDTHMKGSAVLKISGLVKNVSTHMAGSSRFDAANLVTQNASVQMLGSGHASINASQMVSARLYGSASLDYSGNAQINSKKLGSAAINKM